MNLTELEKYYFSTDPLKKIRQKHLPKIKEFLNLTEDDFFNNSSLTEDEFENKRIYLEDKIYDYVISNEKICIDFYNAYGVILIDTLSNLILESLVLDEAIKTNNNINIFMDDRSLAFFDNNLYPLHIFHWKEEEVSLKDYIKEHSPIYDCLDEESEDNIFGLKYKKSI